MLAVKMFLAKLVLRPKAARFGYEVQVYAPAVAL